MLQLSNLKMQEYPECETPCEFDRLRKDLIPLWALNVAIEHVSIAAQIIDDVVQYTPEQLQEYFERYKLILRRKLNDDLRFRKTI